MYYFKNELGYFNEDLPMWESGRYKGKINSKDMESMVLSGVYKGVEFSNIYVKKYIPKGVKNTQFIIEYDGLEYRTECKNFVKGQLGNILDMLVMMNNKYVDENNVVHIFITNTNGNTYEILYSGNHIEEVINSNWCVRLRKSNGNISGVQTNNYNKTSKNIQMHQVDFPNCEVVDHINNDVKDNRIENLRPSNLLDNGKNRKTDNEFGFTGLKGTGSGYINSFKVNGFQIYTRIKYSLEEAKIDNLIAQRYLGYRHNDDLFYLLDELPEDRIKDVTHLLDKKIENNKLKTFEVKKQKHIYEKCDGYYKLIKNQKNCIYEMLVDEVPSEYVRVWKTNNYWQCILKGDLKIINNQFHREILGLRPNDKYSIYRLHVDHLNGNTNDNRKSNLIICSNYSNQYNKSGKGYEKVCSKNYCINLASNYRWFDEFIGGIKKLTVKTEQEAIDEVNRRRKIISNTRIKLNSTEELSELINYCFENGYTFFDNKSNKYLADLDLGYLYWKGILQKNT